MRPYSKDLRLRIVQAYENREGSMRQLTTRFRVSLSCVRDFLTRYRAKCWSKVKALVQAGGRTSVQTSLRTRQF